MINVDSRGFLVAFSDFTEFNEHLVEVLQNARDAAKANGEGFTVLQSLYQYGYELYPCEPVIAVNGSPVPFENNEAAFTDILGAYVSGDSAGNLFTREGTYLQSNSISSFWIDDAPDFARVRSATGTSKRMIEMRPRRAVLDTDTISQWTLTEWHLLIRAFTDAVSRARVRSSNDPGQAITLLANDPGMFPTGLTFVQGGQEIDRSMVYPYTLWALGVKATNNPGLRFTPSIESFCQDMWKRLFLKHISDDSPIPLARRLQVF